MAATIISLPTAARLPVAKQALCGRCPTGVVAPRELAQRREQRKPEPEPPALATQQQIADATKAAGVLGALAKAGFIAGLCVVYRRPNGSEEYLRTGIFEDDSSLAIRAFMQMSRDIHEEDQPK